MTKLRIDLPPEVEPYREDIRRFVDAMVYKLKVHHRKGRWEGKTINEYLPLLQGEVEELHEAVGSGNTIEVLLEAADTANMALIISSIKIERGIDERGTGGRPGTSEEGDISRWPRDVT